MSTTYLSRRDSVTYLQETHGVNLGKGALENMASDGVGPRYVLIVGKALYTREWLDGWVAAEAAKPVVRRRCRDQNQNAA